AQGEEAIERRSRWGADPHRKRPSRYRFSAASLLTAPFTGGASFAQRSRIRRARRNSAIAPSATSTARSPRAGAFGAAGSAVSARSRRLPYAITPRSASTKGSRSAKRASLRQSCRWRSEGSPSIQQSSEQAFEARSAERLAERIEEHGGQRARGALGERTEADHVPHHPRAAGALRRDQAPLPLRAFGSLRERAALRDEQRERRLHRHRVPENAAPEQRQRAQGLEVLAVGGRHDGTREIVSADGSSTTSAASLSRKIRDGSRTETRSSKLTNTSSSRRFPGPSPMGEGGSITASALSPWATTRKLTRREARFSATTRTRRRSPATPLTARGFTGSASARPTQRSYTRSS